MCSDKEYDALLFLSFGGPEGPDDVRPFLENVTRGRGIPPERLDEVGAHYYHFGGKSPLNGLNLELIANLQEELRDSNIHLPIYFGNRNWHPFAEETVEKMAADGVKNALVFATSAWAGYSGCRQYDEDISRIRTHLEERKLPEINFHKLRQFYDHPLYISAVSDLVRDQIHEAIAAGHKKLHLIFTAHSIPVMADNAAGMPTDGPLYSSQVAEASRLVAENIGVQHADLFGGIQEDGHIEYDVVWQSKSGDGRIPWLEPDVVDHLQHLNETTDYDAMIVCPIGFISDHIEVIWDLDSELKAEADRLGVPLYRVPTAGPTKDFQEMVVELIREVTDGAPRRRLGTLPLRGESDNGSPCGQECCSIKRRPAAPSPTH
ncbi:MAG: ferrochelatase [Corynebacterium sp.]|nr:ferrochelatase [Corynebacterium sp.]